jgi:sugar phosphate isomerase/epimerase
MTPDIGVSTQDELSLDEQIAFAGDAGFDFVELLLDGSFRPAELADRTDRITARLEEEGLDLVVHLPFPTDLGSPHRRLREGAVKAHKNWIDTAVELGAEKGVIHPESMAFEGTWDDETLRGYIDDSVEELAGYGRNREFEVCAENIFGKQYTIETIERLLSATDVSMTLDTGHARITGYDETQVAEFVADHEDRIGHVHVNDNREATDEHLPVGAGDIDFETVLGAFSPDWEGTFTLEVSTSSYPYLRQSKAELDAML